MDKRPLPIGIQSFRDIRDQDCHYVDKTGYALRLIREGRYYFLSRPRRFGKSLFVDTLKHLFEGNQDLFVGLEAYGQWDWSVRYPVVKLSFGGGDLKDWDSLQTHECPSLSINGLLEQESLDLDGQECDPLTQPTRPPDPRHSPANFGPPGVARPPSLAHYSQSALKRQVGSHSMAVTQDDLRVTAPTLRAVPAFHPTSLRSAGLGIDPPTG